MKRFLLAIWILFGAAAEVFPQANRFVEEVKAFAVLDSLQPPSGKYVLMLGSSSFTLWKDAETAFAGTRIVNRAFGGSTLADLWTHRHAIVDVYRPAQILLYCGENDFAEQDSVSVQTVVARFERLFNYIRSIHPACALAYVSMKPSPSRRHLWPKFQAANNAIKLLLSRQPNASYIDVYRKMLNADGEPAARLFLPDSLHMNASGYAIWQKAIAVKLVSTHD